MLPFYNGYRIYSGPVHFDMEETGKPSRWNTLRTLRVMKQYTIYNGLIAE